MKALLVFALLGGAVLGTLTLAAQSKKAPVAVPVGGPASAVRLATPQELEKLYLDGHITAKEYQRKLAEFRTAFAAGTIRTNIDPQTRAVELLREEMKRPLPVNTNAVAAVPANPAEEAEQKKLDEFEKRFDELMRQKAAREKAGQAETPAPEPKTKREKLDALLKSFIEGKITEQDYNEKRAQVIAGPE